MKIMANLVETRWNNRKRKGFSIQTKGDEYQHCALSLWFNFRIETGNFDWKSIQFDARHLLSNWFSAETVLMASPFPMPTHRVGRWSQIVKKNCQNNTTNVPTEMNKFSGCDCPCARWTHRKLHQIIACANFRRMDCSNKTKQTTYNTIGELCAA